MTITAPLLTTILNGYQLRTFGTHGVTHWARVLENGRRLAARSSGVSLAVVELFAVFHDARRSNEGYDHHHGLRGAKLAESLRGTLLELGDREFELLYHACAQHTNGHTKADITVQVCWDADRLDLSRVGITPDPRLLCTPAAREADLLAWANERARTRHAPALVQEEWALTLPDFLQ